MRYTAWRLCLDRGREREREKKKVSYLMSKQRLTNTVTIMSFICADDNLHTLVIDY